MTYNVRLIKKIIKFLLTYSLSVKKLSTFNIEIKIEAFFDNSKNTPTTYLIGMKHRKYGGKVDLNINPKLFFCKNKNTSLIK